MSLDSPAQAPTKAAPAFTQLVNLAEERLGARALSVSDDFFAPAENLFKPGRGIFIPGQYTDRGKWMDGWESRRKRGPGHDWCVLQLGLSGIIRGVDIDTNHFLGNHPPFASLDAAATSGAPGPGDFVEILPKAPLDPGSQNFFALDHTQVWTHLRLNIYPDGGVARLKVYGDVAPAWDRFEPGEWLDLAAVQHGGRALLANDMFFSSKDNLIMPGRGVNMGDGWETRRKRVPGHDWVILRLGKAGHIRKVEVDTCHFKGNYPDRCSLEACFVRPGATLEPDTAWETLLPEQKLAADKQHYFSGSALRYAKAATHVRLNIFPDGGVSRLRLLGTLA